CCRALRGEGRWIQVGPLLLACLVPDGLHGAYRRSPVCSQEGFPHDQVADEEPHCETVRNRPAVANITRVGADRHYRMLTTLTSRVGVAFNLGAGAGFFARVGAVLLFILLTVPDLSADAQPSMVDLTITSVGRGTGM